MLDTMRPMRLADGGPMSFRPMGQSVGQAAAPTTSPPPAAPAIQIAPAEGTTIEVSDSSRKAGGALLKASLTGVVTGALGGLAVSALGLANVKGQTAAIVGAAGGLTGALVANWLLAG